MPASGTAADAVEVIGLGPMGQRIVRTYRAAGFTPASTFEVFHG
ncbi:hypothetical protein [Nocardia fluminea]